MDDARLARATRVRRARGQALIWGRLRLLLLLVLTSTPVHAHNGKVAIAVPVSGITVDGDLSDWPEGMTKYAIELTETLQTPRGDDDFSGWFRVGYDAAEGFLYVAVVGRDESTVIDPYITSETTPIQRLWNAHDGCEVYVDLAHGERGPNALQYLHYGNESGRNPIGPGLGASDLGVRRQGGQFTYEWRLAVAEMAQYHGLRGDAATLHRGLTLGFDVSVSDRDEDGSFSWLAWGPGLNKQIHAKSRGNLILAGAGELATFTREDLLEQTGVVCVAEVSGSLWAGTWSGVRRFDGVGFEKLSVPGDSLALPVHCLLGDRQGRLWIGTDGAGVKRYDGETIVSLPGDGPGYRSVFSLLEDRAGVIWAGGYGPPQRFTGTSFEPLETGAAQPVYYVTSICEDRSGNLWFGTWGGARRYDGHEMVTFTTEGGLVDNRVTSVVEDLQGHLWVGTVGGLSRYDGQEWTTFTVDQGLPEDRVTALMVDRDGILWIGLEEGGVSRYDGLVFQTLSPKHGLLSENVTGVCQDAQGAYWIASNYGLTRYQPYETPPDIHLSNVLADRQYGAIPEVTFPSSQEYLAVEFGGHSHKTDLEDLAYVYRLTGHDPGWRSTRQQRIAYTDLPVGEYTFEVKAVDRDLTYSGAPARVTIRVTWPYERIALGLALAVGLLGICWQTVRVVRRDRRLVTANQELVAANEAVLETTRNKSEFLRRMSHDLRSPMNAIIGYTRLVLRKAQGKLEDRQVKNLTNIQTSADNLLNLINDILDLSRIEAGHIELQVRETDLRQLVSECADTLAPLVKPGVELVRELGGVPPIQRTRTGCGKW